MDEDSIIPDDDDHIPDDNRAYSNKHSLNPPKTIIEREPEREPDNSSLEANVTANLHDNDKPKITIQVATGFAS